MSSFVFSDICKLAFWRERVAMIRSADPIDEREQWRVVAREHMVHGAEIRLRAAETSVESILSGASLIVKCFRAGNKVLICGNGGSAADAQHMAAELVNSLSKEFDRPGLPAIALTTDTSFLTAYANDRGWEGVFERQMLALGNADDVLIGISTSGQSKNVIKCLATAREKGLKTIGLFGEGGGLGDTVDQAIVIPSADTQHVQEVLLAVEHIICILVEQTLFGSR
jgi:D-sedoheptulose 7-phosphate isomerase